MHTGFAARVKAPALPITRRGWNRLADLVELVRKIGSVDQRQRRRMALRPPPDVI